MSAQKDIERRRPQPSVSWSSRPFVIGAAILLLAALGLEPALAALQAHFRKTPILPRAPLAEFDVAALPSFKPAPEESPFFDLQADGEVGTDDLLFLRLQEREAFGMEGQIYLFVTYYTNPDDRVPHTPEVCYRQIGGVVRTIKTALIDMPPSEELPAQVAVRNVVMEMASARAVISYVFHVNGRFRTARNDVRLAMGWPGDKRVYFSKIEAVTRCELDEDPSAALARCERLLRDAIPELVHSHFPARAELRRR
jgi:hypothetical protein